MTLVYFALTLAIYFAAKRFYRSTKFLLLSPLIVCPVAIIALLVFTGIPYGNYEEGGKYLTMMLQPATVALAVPMYKYRATVKKYLTEILVSVTGGSVVAIVTSVVFAGYLGIGHELAASLAPRSVTTPIAMNVSSLVGGNPAMTAVFVICTGITGTILTSVLLRCAPIQSPVTKGMMYGISAHGTGTAKAYESGQVEGVVASLAMIFMGIVTTVIAPQVVSACFRILNV